jgi:Transposase DNA-binding/Transposase DDE domain
MLKSYFSNIGSYCKLVDSRLENRFGLITEGIFKNFGESIPSSFIKRSEVKATYNFFKHKSIHYEMLIATERERVLSCLSESSCKVVLAIQDTTELDYTGTRCDSKLGSLSYVHQKGYYLHNHVLFDEQGVGIGVFDQHLWHREASDLGQKRDKRKQEPFENKESYRWYADFETLQDTVEYLPQTKFISITDTEGDIHELLQARRLDNVHYIIRGRGDRKEHVTGLAIKSVVGEQPLAHTYQIDILDCRTNKGQKRTVQLELYYHRLILNASFRHKDHMPIHPIEVTVVYVKEINPPKDIKEPIEWVLYTSLTIENAQDALQIINYYKLRWRIEMFHFVLKQGAKIEQLQLKNPQALQNAIVTYSIVALQVLNLRYATQEFPQHALDSFDNLDIEHSDYQLLANYLNNTFNTKHEPYKNNPTIKDFFELIAQLGGYQSQKNKPPGLKTIWRGWRKWLIIKNTATILRI